MDPNLSPNGQSVSSYRRLFLPDYARLSDAGVRRDFEKVARFRAQKTGSVAVGVAAESVLRFPAGASKRNTRS